MIYNHIGSVLKLFLLGFLHFEPQTLLPYIHLQQNVETSQFQRIFLCPAESNSSFRFCRAFIPVDGIFIKTWFQQILLLAVTLDPNNNILVLACAVVESENRDS